MRSNNAVRVFSALAGVYSLAMLILVVVNPGGRSVPALPKGIEQAKDLPHAKMVRAAHERLAAAPKIVFPNLLGEAKASHAHYRHMVRLYKQVERIRKGQLNDQTRGQLRTALKKMKDRGEYLQIALEHQKKWVSKVKGQLYAAMGLGLLGAILGLIGLLLPSGGLLILGSIAPLIYGVVSQPFPAEPLIFSSVLLPLGILLIVMGIKNKKQAGEAK